MNLIPRDDRLAAERIEHMLRIARATAPHIATRFGKGRTGGYLYVARLGEEITHEPLGTPAPDQIEQVKGFSREKAQRLCEHTNHLLSYQSRNPELNQWGGAIRALVVYLISFSGFPENVDEAFCLALAEAVGLVTRCEAVLMADLSENLELYRQVKDIVLNHDVD